MRICKDCSKTITHGSKTGYCIKCSRKHSSVWNKGLTKIDAPKLSNSGVKCGNTPYNKGLEMPFEQKVKLSCINRGIDIEQFDDFTMPESKRERGKFDDSKVREQCFELANYTCDITKERGGRLVAHHLQSWSDNKELRFEISNLICISEAIHKEFHSKFGKTKNTIEQYQEFKKAKLLELGP